SFLLQAAHDVRTQLPPIGPGQYTLEHWPDLGAVPEFIDALRVARALLTKAHDVDAIASRGRLDKATANAYLWAYHAANLLQLDNSQVVHDTPMTPQRQPASLHKRSGLFARLAARFGLSHNTPVTGAPARH